MSKIRAKSPSEVRKMRRAGRLVAEGLRLIEQMAKPSVTTGELDRLAGEFWLSRGATPAFKGYRGFPCNICTSINHEVVHGIPGERELKEGDLLSVDAGVFLDGYAGDAAVTLEMGRCSPQARKLRRATLEALEAALAVIRPNVRVSEISRAVQEVAERNGFAVVRKYTGHGIGRNLHEPPQIPNFVAPGVAGPDPSLPQGATIAIEPMVNAGTGDTCVLADGWTVVTADHSLSAHFEHTVVVGADGPEVLTLP